MAFEDITNNITTQVKSLMQSKGYTAIYSNDPTAQPTSGYWCYVVIAFGETNQIELGIPLFRTEGVLTVQVLGPLGVGTGVFSEMADIIADFFRNLTIANIKFRAPSIKNVGRTGDLWSVNVICGFHADEN